MAKGSEMIVDYLSVVVKERSAAVAVMTLPVDPPASSQQRCRQKLLKNITSSHSSVDAIDS